MSEKTQSEYDDLVHAKLPQFANQVVKAQHDRTNMVSVHPIEFQDHSELMYAAVMYATKLGLHVCFYPDEMRHPENNKETK